jgi:hypothetical protein
MSTPSKVYVIKNLTHTYHLKTQMNRRSHRNIDYIPCSYLVTLTNENLQLRNYVSSIIHQTVNDEIWRCGRINRNSQIRDKQSAAMKLILTAALSLLACAAAGRPRPKVAGNHPLPFRKTQNISLIKTKRICFI